jgi:hypothetical protein
MSAGITKKKWQIFSSFGRMVFGAQKLIGKAQYSSKLEAIGCIEMPEFATAGCSKLDYLIYSAEIKEYWLAPSTTIFRYRKGKSLHKRASTPTKPSNMQFN